MHTLTGYVVAVIIVWAVILGVMWFFGNVVRFRTLALFCAGFFIGMLAMYIAQHVYPFHPWK